MYIYELVEKLQEFDQNSEVVVYVGDESGEIISRHQIIEVQKRPGLKGSFVPSFLKKVHISIDALGEI